MRPDSAVDRALASAYTGAMRWKPLFVSIWRLHKKALLLTLAAMLTIAGVLVSWGGSSEPPRAEHRPARQLLNRVWFDRLPESNTDEFGVWIWLAGGVGIYQRGSGFRASHDIFEFERQGSAVSMMFLQDQEQVSTEFTIEACDEQPPFDLCLTLSNAPRERNRYYGFGANEDMAAHIPWSPRIMAAARAYAASE
jgi:hypothetical protein